VTDVRVDVAVVGAGLAGAATAWELTRRGVSVALIEQFEPGHSHGSSHGTERIVRRAYADPFYVRLTGRAFDAWALAEEDTGTELLRTTGGLDTGADRDPAGLATLLADEGVPCELLTGAQAEARWPGMRFDGPVLHHPQAAVLDADTAVAARVRRRRPRCPRRRWGRRCGRRLLRRPATPTTPASRSGPGRPAPRSGGPRRPPPCRRRGPRPGGGGAPGRRTACRASGPRPAHR
jgi:glycine/D-amino acid oxidase-like deaminating enzyme